MSHISILTMGSRGDVQPFIALALSLIESGHTVRFGTAGLFEDLVRDYNLPFIALDDEYIRLAELPEGREALENGGASFSLIRKVKPMLRRMLNDTVQVVDEQTDAIIYHPKALAGSHLAEKFNIPHIMSIPLPLYSATGAFPSPVITARDLGGFLNRMTYLVNRVLTLPYQDVINDWRSQIGLDARRWWKDELRMADGNLAPVLYSFSPHVVPPPDDWADNAHALGYWTLPEPDNWTPPADLLAFLEKGDKPVYIGFGSMTGTRASENTRIILEALEQTGIRSILATGWGGLKVETVPDTVHVIQQAPHSWLFDRVSAVVHHGGAGTTAAGLRAGRPTLICPFFGDQPFWGQRVYELGVGPEPIPQKQLDVANLTERLRKLVSDQTMRDRAEQIGKQLSEEDGVGNAVRFIEDYLN